MLSVDNMYCFVKFCFRCLCVTPDHIIKEMCFPIGCGWKVLKILRLEYTGLKGKHQLQGKEKKNVFVVSGHSVHSIALFLNVLDTKCMHNNC